MWDLIKSKSIGDNLTKYSTNESCLTVKMVLGAIDGDVDSEYIRATASVLNMLDSSCWYYQGKQAEAWLSSLSGPLPNRDIDILLNGRNKVCCISDMKENGGIALTITCHKRAKVYLLPVESDTASQAVDQWKTDYSAAIEGVFSPVTFKTTEVGKSPVVQCLLLLTLVSSNGLFIENSAGYGMISQETLLNMVVSYTQRIVRSFGTDFGHTSHPFIDACNWCKDTLPCKDKVTEAQRVSITKMTDGRYLETLNVLTTPESKHSDGSLDVLATSISFCTNSTGKKSSCSLLPSVFIKSSVNSPTKYKFINEIHRSGCMAFVLNPTDHWVTVIIDMITRSLFVIDTLAYSSDRMSTISQQLDGLCSGHSELSGLSRFLVNNSQQTGGVSCGDLSAICMLALSIGFNPFELVCSTTKTFSEVEQTTIRQNLLNVFLSGHKIMVEKKQRYDAASSAVIPVMAQRQVDHATGRKVFASKQAILDDDEGEILGEIIDKSKSAPLSCKNVAALNKRFAQERMTASDERDRLTKLILGTKPKLPSGPEWGYPEPTCVKKFDQTPKQRAPAVESDIDEDSNGENDLAPVSGSKSTAKMQSYPVSIKRKLDFTMTSPSMPKFSAPRQTKLESFGIEKEKKTAKQTLTLKVTPRHSKVQEWPCQNTDASEVHSPIKKKYHTKVLMDVDSDNDDDFVVSTVKVNEKPNPRAKSFFAPKIPAPSPMSSQDSVTTKQVASQHSSGDGNSDADSEIDSLPSEPESSPVYKSVSLKDLNLPLAAKMIKKSDLRFTTDIDGARLLMRVDSEFNGDVYGPGTMDHKLFRSLTRSSPWDSLQVTETNKGIRLLVPFSFSSSHSVLGDHSEHILMDLPDHVNAAEFYIELCRLYPILLAQNRHPSTSRILTATPHPEACQYAIVPSHIKHSVTKALVAVILEMERETDIYFCVQVFGSKYATRSDMLTFAELPGETVRLNNIVETVFNRSAFAPRDLLADYGFNVGVIDGKTGPNTVLAHPNGSKALFNKVIPALKVEVFTTAMMVETACNVYGLVHSRNGAKFNGDDSLYKINSYLEGLRNATSTDGKSHLGEVSFRALLDLVQFMASDEMNKALGSLFTVELNIMSMLVKNLKALAKDPQVMRYEMSAVSSTSALSFFNLVIDHTPTLLYTVPSTTLFEMYANTLENWMSSSIEDEKRIFPYSDPTNDGTPGTLFALRFSLKNNICRAVLTGGSQRNKLVNYILENLPVHNELGMPQPDIPDDILQFVAAIPGLPDYISSHETVVKLLVRPMMPQESEKSQYRKMRHASRVLICYILMENELLATTTDDTDMETKLRIVLRHGIHALCGDVIQFCTYNGDGKTKVSRALQGQINENKALLCLSELRNMWPQLNLTTLPREDNMVAYLVEFLLFACRKDTKILFLALPNVLRFGFKLIGYHPLELALSQPALSQCGKIFAEEIKSSGLDLIPLTDFKLGSSSFFKANSCLEI